MENVLIINLVVFLFAILGYVVYNRIRAYYMLKEYYERDNQRMEIKLIKLQQQYDMMFLREEYGRPIKIAA
ncbi:hypothetical protein KKG31_06560 [Patescibacteria group bacterium]|nr:hypothetical protein [Patescibacteria group bacterium]MBU1758752.1 hypothetical protein [Patescibacteria group bacterium]